ncbi:hypothetical protein HMPREF3213_01330 [Heyndrickxia coagulans]|uniref:Uncharacterized protein n=1 Tax=Heyndrickxia coagulans TaxID=1398 RepID=A0A133KUV7_HEYCO|nr:hypothetical protein HMPREF3213_01330 [Heyndrickxia coagulans]
MDAIAHLAGKISAIMLVPAKDGIMELPLYHECPRQAMLVPAKDGFPITGRTAPLHHFRQNISRPYTG